MESNKENEFISQVDNLIRELENSSDAQDVRLAKKAKQLRSEQKKFEKTIADLQEALDYLRVAIKYLVFDLEATRRENVYLRRLLEKGDENAGD